MTPDEVAGWWGRAGLPAPESAAVEVVGADPVLPARHRIGEGAAAALAAVGVRVAALARPADPPRVRVEVTAAAASLLSFVYQRLDRPGPSVRARDATTALYCAGDGRWIHLHGGFPHLAEGTLALLGLSSASRDDADAVARAVADWDAVDLEDALASRRLCGAMVRSPEEWSAHAQGAAVAGEPTVAVERLDGAESSGRAATPVDPSRPLAGLRVLDCTRVLAGPTCGRTLALFGADVLRVGAGRLPSIEPFVIDTGPGKRAAFLDLADAGDHAAFCALVGAADVVVCGYRPGAFERLGLGPADLVALRPGLVVASVDCYGHAGPWADRAGWEQLAQSASGMAYVEGGPDAPALVPAAATDYTTGYLAAAGVLEALRRARDGGGSHHVRASLCATAAWFAGGGVDADPGTAPGPGAPETVSFATSWGRLTRLAPPLDVDAVPARWDAPPVPLGTHRAEWLPRP